MRFGTTMNVPLAMPLARITCSHSGSVSKPGWSGSEPIAVGYTITSAPSSAYERATSGNHWSQHVGKPNAGVVERDDGEAGVAGPEVAVLVVAGGDREVHLARARGERSVGRDDDRGVEARRFAVVPARTATRARERRSRPRSSAANACVGPPGSGSGSTPAAAAPSRCDREVRRGSAPGGTRAARLRSAATRTPSASAARCSAGSGCQRSCTRPTRNGALRLLDARGRGRDVVGGEESDVHAAPTFGPPSSRLAAWSAGPPVCAWPGTCLVMQCTPPPPYASTAPGTATTSRPGYSLGDERERIGVGRRAGRRHEHGAVHRVQVHVGHRQQSARADACVRQDGDFDDVDPGRFESLAIVGRDRVVGVGAIGATLEQRAPAVR